MSFLNKLFPFISAAAAAGGPLGVLAAKAVGAALGIDGVQPTAAGVAAALDGASPQQMEALVRAEQDFKLKMETIGFDHVEALERIAAEDRKSARDREVQAKDSWTPRALAAAVTLGFFSILIVLMSHELPGGAKEAALLLLGSLAASFGAVVQYYFGSSAGSEHKTELLAAGKANGPSVDQSETSANSGAC